MWTLVPWKFDAATAVAWLPWLNGQQHQDWFLVNHKFVYPKANLLVRPNLRRNGFDIHLRTLYGVNWYTTAEFYARNNTLPYKTNPKK